MGKISLCRSTRSKKSKKNKICIVVLRRRSIHQVGNCRVRVYTVQSVQHCTTSHPVCIYELGSKFFGGYTYAGKTSKKAKKEKENMALCSTTVPCSTTARAYNT